MCLYILYLKLQIQTPIDCVSAIYTVLSRRRGHITADVPQPGTPAYIVKVSYSLFDRVGKSGPGLGNGSKVY